MSLIRWWRRLWGQEPKPPEAPDRSRAPETSQPPQKAALETSPAQGWPGNKGLHERLLRDRIVMIGTPINDEVATGVIAELLFLESEDPRAGISLYLNSPGGSVTASLAICDTLKYLQSHQQPVSTICMGQCVGTAALLLALGTRGQRFSLPQGHIALVPLEMGAGLTEAKMLAARQDLYDTLAELLVDCTGQTRERVLEDLLHGREFDPAGARAYGLIDSVVKR